MKQSQAPPDLADIARRNAPVLTMVLTALCFVFLFDLAQPGQLAFELLYVPIMVAAAFVLPVVLVVVSGLISATLILGGAALTASSQGIVVGDRGLSLLCVIGVVLLVPLFQRDRRIIVERLAVLSELSQRKNAFLARLSHELRTPLTAIIGFADVIGQDSSLEEEQLAQQLQINAQYLLELVDDVLDLAKVEADRLEIVEGRVNLARFLASIHAAMRHRAQEKGLGLNVRSSNAIPKNVYFDVTRVRQVLLNLLGNAIKFTKQGEVSLAIRFETDGPNNYLAVSVSDTGRGIPADELATVFEPFSRGADSIEENVAGSGLGLAISKRIVDRLEGTIDVTSRPDVGTTFVVRLPIRVDQHTDFITISEADLLQPLESKPVQSTHCIEAHILLAEDVPSNQYLIRRHLESVGARVTVVENGQLACDAVESSIDQGEEFDAILMDMHMPVLDGFEAVKRLRSTGCRIPIIALTASAMRGDRERCLSAGCVNYLSKPIARNDLLDAVSSVCSGRRLSATNV